MIWLMLFACRNTDCDPASTIDSGAVQDSGSDDSGSDDSGDVVEVVDADGDGFSADEDCDDEDADISPDAEERCDQVDNNCNGLIDEDATDAPTWYIDYDGDGHGADVYTLIQCEQPAGYVNSSDDCDDSDPRSNPSAYEICYDDIDQNCDGSLDSDSCTYTLADAPNRMFSTDTMKVSSEVNGVGDITGDGSKNYIQNNVYPTYLSDTQESALYVFQGELLGGVTPEDAVYKINASPDDGALAAVSGEQDFNGDGIADLLIRSPHYSAPGTNTGAVYLIHGPLSTDQNLSSEYDSMWVGEASGDLASFSASWIGDSNQDGFADFLVGVKTHGSSGDGIAYLIQGSDSASLSNNLADTTLKVYGSTEEGLGYKTAHLGDLNGDGVDDFALVAYRADFGARNSGRTYVFHGPITDSFTLDAAVLSVDGVGEADQLGSYLSRGGDIDGDGTGDIIISSQHEDFSYTSSDRVSDEGVAYIVSGASQGAISASEAKARIYGAGLQENFGRSCAHLGDIDQDGFADVAISSKLYGENGAEYGRTGIFMGPLEGTRTSDNANILFVGEYEGSRAGILLKNIGDTNQDGFDEIAIGGGRPESDGTVFGISYILDLQSYLP
ncbi:MAG: MopE-related protein [Myxococcota bacterium]|nr:MopE-related protein [Myxococcota bacterium]